MIQPRAPITETWREDTVRHHVALRLLRHFEVPDGDTAVSVTTYELLAFVMPADRTQRLHVRMSQTSTKHCDDRKRLIKGT